MNRRKNELFLFFPVLFCSIDYEQEKERKKKLFLCFPVLFCPTEYKNRNINSKNDSFKKLFNDPFIEFISGFT